jgi:hypothetical protein
MASPAPQVSVGEIYRGTGYSSDEETGESLGALRARLPQAILKLVEHNATDPLPQEDQKEKFLSRLPAMGKP